MSAASAAHASAASAPSAAPAARPHLVTEQFKQQYVGGLVASWPTASQLPVCYHDKYNISFFGIEKLHPFDACKFRKVVRSLTEQQLISQQQLVEPLEASQDTLADVHSAQYLREIHTSTLRVVQVTELAPLALLPCSLLQWRVVSPMKHHVAGTMLAGALAIERGWAVNLGGGMHHAYHSAGGGWCPFDDIMLCIRRLRKASGGAIKRVMVIDLDVHQGNGIERDKLHFNDTDLFILDMYHQNIYPNDLQAVQAIDIDVPLHRGTDDTAYLSALHKALATASERCPDLDLVVYNAGTDILDGDPLGRLHVSAEGVVARDQAVWAWALNTAHCPILMTLSGGYSKASAQVISASLANLMTTFNLTGSKPAAEA